MRTQARRLRAVAAAAVALSSVVAILWGAILWGAFGARAQAPDAGIRLVQADVAFERGEVVIETREGPRRLSVEIARTPEQRQRGLMFRTELARDGGMLFVFEQPGEVRMWMKNTLIPLDMLFIEPDGRIRRIARRTTPLSEKTIASGGPVSAVLELAAGAADRLGIAPGDRVRAEALGDPNSRLN